MREKAREARPWKAVIEAKRIHIQTMDLEKAYGCIDCRQVSSGAPHGTCLVCGSLNIHSIARLFTQLKTTVSGPTGIRRLVLALPPRRAAQSTVPPSLAEQIPHLLGDSA